MVAFSLIATQELEGDQFESYDEVVNNKKSQNWIATMNDELSSLYKNVYSSLRKEFQGWNKLDSKKD